MRPHLNLTVVLVLVQAVASAQEPVPRIDNATVPNRLVEGRPVESRPPEKADNKPAFPEQTRAPYEASKPFTITTLVDGITAPWSLAFLPGGNILLTERLPGKMRLLHADGRLSEPLSGVSLVSVLRSNRHRPARRRPGSGIRDDTSNLLHFFRLHRSHEQQHLSGTSAAGRSRDGADRRHGNFSRTTSDALKTPRRQDRWTDGLRCRRQPLSHDRRSFGFTALGRRTTDGYASGQGAAHHARRRAGAGQSVSGQTRCSTGDLGLWVAKC